MRLTQERPRRRQVIWHDLVDREPCLRDLERDVRAIAEQMSDAPVFCANAAWFGWRTDGTCDRASMARRLDRLVGWHSDGSDALLLTSDAYHVATRYLRALLPPCRKCGCAPVEARSGGGGVLDEQWPVCSVTTVGRTLGEGGTL